MKMGIIGIIIRGDRSIAMQVNLLLAEYGDIVLGRMGVPNASEKLYVISLIVKAPLETLSALTGKLGKLKGVKVKSAVTDYIEENK